MVRLIGDEEALQARDHQLVVNSHRSECCGILTLVGELDLATVEEVGRHVAALTQEDPPKHVLVDMVELTFMDSTGLRALLRLKELVDGHVALIGPHLGVRKVFDVTGLADQFPQFADIEAAQEHFHSMP